MLVEFEVKESPETRGPESQQDRRSKAPLRQRGRSPSQSLGHHLAVHDGDVYEEQQDHKQVVHEPQQAEERLGDKVQRGGQVRQRPHQAQQDAEAEHPEEPAH